MSKIEDYLQLCKIDSAFNNSSSCSSRSVYMHFSQSVAVRLCKSGVEAGQPSFKWKHLLRVDLYILLWFWVWHHGVLRQFGRLSALGANDLGGVKKQRIYTWKCVFRPLTSLESLLYSKVPSSFISHIFKTYPIIFGCWSNITLFSFISLFYYKPLMTNAGRSVILVYLALACELVIRQ